MVNGLPIVAWEVMVSDWCWTQQNESEAEQRKHGLNGGDVENEREEKNLDQGREFQGQPFSQVHRRASSWPWGLGWCSYSIPARSC